MDKQLFSARSAYFLKPIGGFNFPADVSAIETRDEAIFTKLKPNSPEQNTEKLQRGTPTPVCLLTDQKIKKLKN